MSFREDWNEASTNRYTQGKKRLRERERERERERRERRTGDETRKVYKGERSKANPKLADLCKIRDWIDLSYLVVFKFIDR